MSAFLLIVGLITSVACNIVLWRNLFAWRRVALTAERQADRYFEMWAALQKKSLRRTPAQPQSNGE